MSITKPINELTQNNYNIETILEQYDQVIDAFARRVVLRNASKLISSTSVNLLIDEIKQNTRFKLWRALQEKCIHYLVPYIKRIVFNEFINIVRQYKASSVLPLNEFSETDQGFVLLPLSDEMQDPALIVERQEEHAELITRLVDALLTLPPSQQHAMICSIKDQIDDLLQLMEVFRGREVNIESVSWPEEKDEVRRLKASISVARKKLYFLKSKSM